MTDLPDSDDWTAWWDARMTAMRNVLGDADGMVGHATIPFEVGAELGGAADIVYFRTHVPGVVSVTSELIGRDAQLENSLGNYELAICHRDDEPWGPGLISRLALYTLEAVLEPGETMDIATATPEGSTIAAFLFQEFARFEVLGRRAGILLCLGITSEELALCRSGKSGEVERSLRDAGVYPYTDLYREPHVPTRRKWRLF
jgi:suppressor of fused protein SUFU